MKKRFCTTIEQGQKLIALGVDPKTADLYITPKIGGYVISSEQSSNSKPTWSQTALVGLLPVIAEEILSKQKTEAGFICVHKRLHVAGAEAVEKGWKMFYPQMFYGFNKDGYGYANGGEVLYYHDGPVVMGCYDREEESCWINSAVDLICWCYDYGLLKKGGE